MAQRPVFAPARNGTAIVEETLVEFRWHPGFAPSQKKKCVDELHRAAAALGLEPLLEVSSKSELPLGRDLSAFNLEIAADGAVIPLECAFQGSKVFEAGGPYDDLFQAGPREAKRDPRLKESGPLTGFRFQGRDFPLSPKTAFYDWLYLQALTRREASHDALAGFAGFTDIEFNPKRSLNCQARSCAIFLSLRNRGVLDAALSSFDKFAAFY